MALLLITEECTSAVIAPYYNLGCNRCGEEWSTDNDAPLYCPFCGEEFTDREYVGDNDA